MTVPSDHTATTEDADLRERIVDALVMSPMSDTVGTDMAPVHRTADTILPLLATARPDTTTEWGVRDWSGVRAYHSEQNARDHAPHAAGNAAVVRREVGGWTEADRG